MFRSEIPCQVPRSLLTRAVRTLPAVLALAMLALATGCPTGDDKDSVSGKITLDGQGVGAQVIFIGPDGKESPPAATDKDGNYKVLSPPIGSCKVVVKSMDLMAGAGGGGAPKSTQPDLGAGGGTGGKIGVSPPPKYGKAETTDLKFEVKGGKQVNADFTLSK